MNWVVTQPPVQAQRCHIFATLLLTVSIQTPVHIVIVSHADYIICWSANVSLYEAKRPMFEAVGALFKLGTVDFSVPRRRCSTFATEVGDVFLIGQELDMFQQQHFLFSL